MTYHLGPRVSDRPNRAVAARRNQETVRALCRAHGIYFTWEDAMERGPFDETLAFTALIELDPGYRDLSSREATTRRDEMLEDWWALAPFPDGGPAFWVFARIWLSLTGYTEPAPPPRTVEDVPLPP